jgi:hypothetical protein
MTWKLYAVVSAGAFLATYLVSSPADVARPVASAKPASTEKPAAGADIEQLAEGLHVRLRTDNYRTPGRDLFRFEARPVRPAVASSAQRPVVEAAAPPPPPPLPPLTLSGVATDIVDGSPRRQAVMSAPTNMWIVREGESVAGLYKVLSIGEDSVELEALADGSHRTLRLSGK